MINFHAAILALLLCCFRPPFRDLVAYHMEREGMSLYDGVAVNYKQGSTILITSLRCRVNGLRGVSLKIVHA